MMKLKPITLVALSLIAALALASAIGWSVAIQRGQTIQTYEVAEAADKAAAKARKDKADEIEKTPAADLVDMSPRAGELAGARDDRAERAADRIIDAVRSRVREILSGGGSGAAP